MYKGKKILAIIPARGGSKGIIKKNIKLLGNKPLIAWTIEEAKKSKYIDRLILSSDDQEIIEIARKWHCEVPFVRPEELARDDTPSIDTLIHAINIIPEKYDYVCMLQPTSPLRKAEDIDGSIQKCIIMNSNCCVSVVKVEQHPYWMYEIVPGDELRSIVPNNITRRQDLPEIYILNGAVYIAKVEVILNNRSFLGKDTIGYKMERERSFDIDNNVDFNYCQMFVNGK